MINKLLEDYVVSIAMSIRYNNGIFPYILILLSYKPNIIAKEYVRKITDSIILFYEWQKITASIDTWIWEALIWNAWSSGFGRAYWSSAWGLEESIDFPGDPLVKTPCFHCRGRSLILVEGLIPHMSCNMAKKKKKRIRRIYKRLQ